jgi:hypothetical protein
MNARQGIKTVKSVTASSELISPYHKRLTVDND